MKTPEKNQKKIRGNGFLNLVERVGNKLPDPFILFVLLAAFVMVLSLVFKAFGASVTHPGTGDNVAVRSLISGDGVEFILTSMLDNFTGFAPLGLVLSIMLGIGLAEKVGLLDFAIRKTALKAPVVLLPYVAVFLGIMGNIASDAAVVIIPPLTAIVFYKAGRHPIAGLAAGFAGAGAGFTANLLITGTDALLAGISTEAAQIVDESMTISPVVNWYFSMVSVVVLTVVGGLITNRMIEPRLGKYTGPEVEEDETAEEDPRAKKGLINAIIFGGLYVVLLAIAVLIPTSPLRGENGSIIDSPFISGIVPLILIFFVIIGVSYGITVGKIKSGKDVSDYMTEAIKDMAGYIVLVFAIAQFISYFTWSNLGIWVAVEGAEFLKGINFTGIPLIICYVLFTAGMNFLITSGSAKWAIEAPIFVPMFMQLGYAPAFTQAAYRIADSSMNIVTPLFPYMVIILAFMKKYDKNAKIGTYISLMLPYSVAFLLTWIVILLAFFYTGLPLGPGAHTLM